MVGDMVGDSATKKLGSSVREHKNQYGYHLINGPPPEGMATRTHFTLLVMTSEYTGALRMGQDLGYLGGTVIKVIGLSQHFQKKPRHGLVTAYQLGTILS